MANQKIVRGSVQNPYREFTYTLQPNEAVPIQYAANYFRVLSQNGGVMEVRFGASGGYSQFVGAGIGYELDEIIEFFMVRNVGIVPMTFTVALAVGRIWDDRLNVSGIVSVDVINPDNDPVPVKETVSQSFTNTLLVLAANVPRLLVAANSNTKKLLLSPGNAAIYLGPTNAVTVLTGYPLLANAAPITIEDYIGDIWVVSSGPANAVCAKFLK